MSDAQWFELLKIALDKGLFALLVLLAGAVFSRNLERYKAAQAWYTELARSRLALARRLVTEAQTVATQLYHSRILHTAGKPDEARAAVRECSAACGRLGIEVNEAGVLFSEELAAAFEAVGLRAREFAEQPITPESTQRQHAVMQDTLSGAAAFLRASLTASLPHAPRGARPPNLA